MGLFRKKSYHVGEAGRIVEGEEPGLSSVDRVRGPTRYEKYKQSRAEERKVYQEAKEEARTARLEAFKEARIKRAREAGRRAGSITFGDRLESFAKGIGGPSKPVSRKSSYNPPSPQLTFGYGTKNNYNPFGSMFDTGIGFKQPKIRVKKQSHVKYAVVGGKAYPLAGYGKKKSKRKKTSSNKIDMFDNWGLM